MPAGRAGCTRILPAPPLAPITSTVCTFAPRWSIWQAVTPFTIGRHPVLIVRTALGHRPRLHPVPVPFWQDHSDRDQAAR
jgi:hypothetical protein